MSRSTSDQQLLALEALLLTDPNNVEVLYLRASLLVTIGRDEDAKQAYLSIIARDPTHFGALNDLGTILHKTDFRAAARTAYAEAVTRHPKEPIGRINLGNALIADGQFEAARDQLQAALILSADHPDAHQGLANLFQETGDWEAAEYHRHQSYRGRTVSVQPYCGSGKPIRLLLLVSAVGGNIPTRFLLDDHVFETSVLVVEAQSSQAMLPDHDLIFNAVGDADLCSAALDEVDKVLGRSRAPVVNRPQAVRLTGRAQNAGRLGALKDVRAPTIRQVARQDLTSAAAGMRFPVLIRSLGFHTGRHFLLVPSLHDLERSAADLPGAELLLLEYLNAKGKDGRWRKYRAMLVGGELFPLHLAVSNTWKVHYFTADMADRPDHRAEEALFLNDMASAIGARAHCALERLSKCLELDYGGVDFAVGKDGELLVFEANATMVVNPPPPEPIWDYRRSAVRRIFSATESLLTQRADLG